MIHIVDDEEPLRDSLAWLLRSRDLPCRAFASAEDYLAYLQAADADPGVPTAILLDVRMGGLSGTELFERLRAEGRFPAWPVVFLTGHGDVPMAVEAMQAGAVDFIQKPFRDQDLLDRINQALDKDAGSRRMLAERNMIRKRLESLTPREGEVLHLVVAGKANKVIAGDLNLSQRTVEIHRARVMEKMEAHSLAHLVRMVLEVERPDD